MDPYEAIISKRDIRHYSEEGVPDEILSRILQAGRMAGSAKNEEATRLLVVREQAVKEALAEAGDFSSWIGTAAFIIGLAAPTDSLRMFDLGRMAQNMMVAAHNEGVASCPVTLHHPDRARAASGLAADWDMPMVVTFGRPLPDLPESPLRRTRVAMSELVSHDRWT